MSEGTPRDDLFRKELSDPERLKHHLQRLIELLNRSLDPQKKYLVYILAQSSRIGHLGVEPWYINTLFGASYQNIVIVTGPGEQAANRTLFDYLKSRFTIIETDDIVFTTMGFIDFGAFGVGNYDFYLRAPLTLMQEFSRSLAAGLPHRFLDVPAESAAVAQAFRRDVLGDDDRPHVFLHVRDSGFAPDMAYHSYRFNNIHAYRDSVEMLLGKGFAVLRSGDRASPELDIDHPHYFEIMRHEKYDRGIDFHIALTSAFGMVNQSGPLALFQAFGLPHLLTNAYPISAWFFLEKELAVYKHYRNGEGRRVSLSTLIEADLPKFGTTARLEEAGLHSESNNAEEILAGAEEMLDIFENGTPPDPEIQRRFYEITAAGDESVLGAAAADPVNPRIQQRLSRRFVAMTPDFLS